MSDYLPLTFTEATTVTSGLISEEARRIYWAYGDVYAKAAGRITRTWATTIRARDVLGLGRRAMILAVSIGDVQATVDTEGETMTPEHAADYLNRCADAAMRLFDRLPDTTDG